MKAMQIVIFFFLFNAFLFIFTSVGVYQLNGNYELDEGWVEGREGGTSFLESVTKVAGAGVIGAALAGVVAHFLAGVTGLQTISISLLIGLFTGFFYNTYSVLSGIIESIPYGNVIQSLLILTGSMFIIMLLYGVAQMGMGGGKAYE